MEFIFIFLFAVAIGGLTYLMLSPELTCNILKTIGDRIKPLMTKRNLVIFGYFLTLTVLANYMYCQLVGTTYTKINEWRYIKNDTYVFIEKQNSRFVLAYVEHPSTSESIIREKDCYVFDLKMGEVLKLGYEKTYVDGDTSSDYIYDSDKYKTHLHYSSDFHPPTRGSVSDEVLEYLRGN